MLKNVLKLIFCPIWFLFDHNPNEAIVNTSTKNNVVRTVIIVCIVIIVLFLCYIKEIL